jgi:hypothetical protein
MRSNVQGTVYLLHFLEPIGNPTNPAPWPSTTSGRPRVRDY